MQNKRVLRVANKRRQHHQVVVADVEEAAVQWGSHQHALVLSAFISRGGRAVLVRSSPHHTSFIFGIASA